MKGPVHVGQQVSEPGGRWNIYHAPRHDDDRYKSLRPVNLVHRCRCYQDRANRERRHGQQHDILWAEPAHQERHRSRSQNTGYADRDELGCDAERPVMSEFQGQLPAVEEPDAEARPAASNAAEEEDGVEVERLHRHDGVFNAGFYEEEQGEKHDSDDEKDVRVCILPADAGALIPGDVKHDQSRHPGDGTEDIQDTPICSGKGCWGWNDQVCQDRQDNTHDGHDPVRPRPPSELGEDAREQSAQHKPVRSQCTKDTEDDILLPAGRVYLSQYRERVGQQNRRPDTLQCPRDDEKDMSAIDAEASDQRPYSEPDISDNHHETVTVHVTKAARDQDEGARGQAVCGRVPSQFSGRPGVQVAGDDVQWSNSLSQASLREQVGHTQDDDHRDLVIPTGWTVFVLRFVKHAVATFPGDLHGER